MLKPVLIKQYDRIAACVIINIGIKCADKLHNKNCDYLILLCMSLQWVYSLPNE